MDSGVGDPPTHKNEIMDAGIATTGRLQPILALFKKCPFRHFWNPIAKGSVADQSTDVNQTIRRRL